MRLLVFIVIVTLICQIPPVKKWIQDSIKEVRTSFFSDLEGRSRIKQKARRQQQLYRRQRSSTEGDRDRRFDRRSVSQQLTDTRSRTIREMGGY